MTWYEPIKNCHGRNHIFPKQYINWILPYVWLCVRAHELYLKKAENALSFPQEISSIRIKYELDKSY
jgi:hypothetical protein